MEQQDSCLETLEGVVYNEPLMKKPKKMILTAGPSITRLEERYVLDAVRNGWNFHFNDYIKRFEKAISEYIGVKHAIATSSGTGALHLSLLAMGIGKGDEVILPEISAVASANVITFTGAKPIFVDIEEDTWCMDPISFKKSISKNTRAVMPVHLYGHPSNMGEINKIAKEHGLYVLEDACPSLGATYNNKKTGSLGDMATFSFQGAKIAVTGEGGMLLTNNTKLFEKASHLANLGRVREKGAFWHDTIGYKYAMSNIQAALGLAQLEQIESLISAKRKIFSWYRKRLEGIDGISINTERKWAKNIYWMSSIVLNKKFKVTRDELMKKLYESNIDTRPFFFPFSMLPIYKTRVNNPVAYKVALSGINLPSGVQLKEKEVDYVAKTIRRVLDI